MWGNKDIYDVGRKKQHGQRLGSERIRRREKFQGHFYRVQ